MDPAPGHLLEACRDVLEAALAEAQTAWGAFALPLERFAARAAAHVERRLERAGTEVSPAAARDVLRRTARADLALAVACDEGVAGAWEVLARGAPPPARRSRAQARPRRRRRRGARVRRARGTGAAGHVERRAHAARDLRRDGQPLRVVRGDPGPAPGAHARTRDRSARRSPWRRSGNAPAAARTTIPRTCCATPNGRGRFERTLRTAWTALTGRERLALAYRFLDGVPQTAIARVLGISEPHTSRLVTGAVAKLEAAVVAEVGAEGGGTRLWAALADAVRKNLVSTSAVAPLPDGRRPAPRGDPMTTDDDTAAESVTRHVAGDGATATCPDGNLLAGFAERTLTVAETEAVATHASGCAACRSTLVDLAAALGRGGRRRHTRRARAVPRAGPRGVDEEPCARTACGGPQALRGRRARARGSRRGDLGACPRAQRDSAARPRTTPGGGRTRPRGGAAAARGLRAARAGRDRTSRRRRSSAAASASSRRRTSCSPGRPTFRWLPVGGVTRYEVRLAKDGGATLFTRTSETPALDYPADVPALEPGGRYVWTVAVEAVLGGRTEARRTFAVATPETSAKFAASTRALAEHAPEDLVDLLAAHWALRHDLVAEAERFASAYSAKQRSDALGMRTLLHVWRRQGVPEGQTGPRAPGSR